MKNFKKITLGLLGATILSLGLYACGNDNEATTTNPSTEQNVMASKESYEFVKVPLPDHLQSYDANVVEIETKVELFDSMGKSFSGLMKYSVDGIGKLNKVEISSNLLESGLITKDMFVGNPELVNTILGNSSPHSDCIKGCVANFSDGKGNATLGYGHCIAGCYIESTGRLIESIGKALGNALDKVVITISKVIKK